MGALLPIAALLLFYAYVARATLVLGRLPAPYNPDPKDLELIFHHYCIGVVMDLALVSPLLVLIARLLPSVDSGRSSVRWLTLWFGSYCVMIVLALSDPGDLMCWYAD
ncbi:MAG: hypothetical protein ACYTGW_18075 [Planctomycetota bacterium]